MKKIIIGLGLYYALIGIYMLFFPVHFYENTPGVSMMGPYNSHFIKDVSFAFLTSGFALQIGAFKSITSTIVVGALWPFMHALFHMAIWINRGFIIDHVTVSDFLAVIIPGFLAMILAIKFKEVRGV